MNRAFSLAAAVVVCAGVARAQTVEFRLVERTGRTAVTGASDAQLNFAVQARVMNATPNRGLGLFDFNIRFLGEPEAFGTLNRCLISNTDYTYTSAFGISSAIGRGGLASAYIGYAGLNAAFNGVFNINSGTFTNTPDQEIGLIAGWVQTQSTADLDMDGDGAPDTWTGGATAPLDPAVAGVYLAGGGNWCDIYRFRYTVTNFTPRTLHIRLANPTSSTFTNFEVLNGSWWTIQAQPTGAFAADLAIGVGGTVPTGVCCDLETGACSSYVIGSCAGGYMSASSCTPNPCGIPGSCCLSSGQCTTSPQANCTGTWSAAGSCVPNPCPPAGKCCTANHACSVKIQSACLGPWTIDLTCTPNDCPYELGRCCSASGWCAYLTEANCTETWTSGNSTCTSTCPPTVACCQTSGVCQRLITCAGTVIGTVCTPNPCPQPGRCCAASGSCSIKLESLCTTGPWTAGTSCAPNPCPPASRCCAATGSCSVRIQSACTGVWTPSASCSSACPQPGRCCNALGACTLALQTACTDIFSVGSCTTGICAQLGGCCNGLVCATTTLSGCPSTGGQAFGGVGTLCGTAANPIACCKANFNRVDGVTSDDLFAYLNAWFALDPACDTDRNGTISVGDLTLFFNLWMAGC